MRNVPLRTEISMRNLLIKGVPRQYAEATLKDYTLEDDLFSLFERYLSGIELMFYDCVNLLMYGANGTGKTWLSSLIVKEAYIHRFSSYRVTLQTYLDLQFKKENPEALKAMERVENADFLVIDEVGKETFSKSLFNVTVLEELLRKRETLGKPTIICTNLPLENGLYEQYGKSIESLISGNYLPIKFMGSDFRRSITKERKGVKFLLGGE